MSKISIVGVEGSGKTTLMAAFGEKYERPDENGYSLDPKDERTYATISTLTGAMRNGEWPASTEKSRVNALSWTLLRRSGEQVEELGDLSFLDYAADGAGRRNGMGVWLHNSRNSTARRRDDDHSPGRCADDVLLVSGDNERGVEEDLGRQRLLLDGEP